AANGRARPGRDRRGGAGAGFPPGRDSRDAGGRSGGPGSPMSAAAEASMTAAIDPGVFDSIETLRAFGFEGFATVSDLMGSRCSEVPVARGAYLVAREPALPPKLMPGSAAGHWRGQNPSVRADMLAPKWVNGAIVLYVGHAAGTGVRGQLQQRIKRMIRFGTGKAVAHWGGRYVWQLADHRKLRFAWKLTDDAAALEARPLAAFQRPYAPPPFPTLLV